MEYGRVVEDTPFPPPLPSPPPFPANCNTIEQNVLRRDFRRWRSYFRRRVYFRSLNAIAVEHAVTALVRQSFRTLVRMLSSRMWRMKLYVLSGCPWQSLHVHMHGWATTAVCCGAIGYLVRSPPPACV